MKKTVLILTVIVALAFVGSAFAVPKGKTVEFESTAGKVVFDGTKHAEKDLKCNSCHTKLFPMKKGGKYTMKEMEEGKACGACHDGKTEAGHAFSVKDKESCGKCHKK